MITTLAIHGYRSLRELVLPLAPMTLVTGPNGAGKSSLYRALRLLAATAEGGVVAPLAHDGGLERVLWAGPEIISGGMRRGEVPVEGAARRKKPVSLMLGFTTDDLGYLIDIGLPPVGHSLFVHDPVIKREELFVPPLFRPAGALVRRKGATVTLIGERGSRPVLDDLSTRTSMLAELADPQEYPELRLMRRTVSSWRFYDSFRTDTQAPARESCVGTWTPVLAPDGHDLAAAYATVAESAWGGPLVEAIDQAFPGTTVSVAATSEGRFGLVVQQPGMLRPLTAAELSDGTLRFLLLAVALLSPQPPSLLVLNEPETSLHPHALPILAELISRVAERTQVIIVSHAQDLIRPLVEAGGEERVVHHHLVKNTGETLIEGQGLLTTPTWNWGSR
ncbi:AAA family ATPase [Propionibacteriaceae bacterium Y1923]|uniref:AAA family ATPase n=1 Tax=Aestuariimicrobium sp. Y1814 TaxID=3418742 RepID=UPI003C26DACF